MSQNAATLRSYEANSIAYINSRHLDDVARFCAWIVEDLHHINMPNGAHIFEIGTGPGYFTDYIESLGYQVIRTDAAQSFIDFNISRKKTMEKFNVVTDKFPEQYNVILALNVMQHLEKPEALSAFKKIFKVLLPGGSFIFTITTGNDNDELHADKGGARYFYNWDKKELRSVLENEGYIITRYDDAGYRNWMNITVEKKHES